MVKRKSPFFFKWKITGPACELTKIPLAEVGYLHAMATNEGCPVITIDP